MNETKEPAAIAAGFSHADALGTLARADAGEIKAFAEELLDAVGPVEVLASRTGLVMLPYLDTVQNTAFHLGEVLVAEAHIRLSDFAVEGYGAVTGRDLEHAMAMAVIDASLAADVRTDGIDTFLDTQQQRQRAADDMRLRKVEATRVRMETF